MNAIGWGWRLDREDEGDDGERHVRSGLVATVAAHCIEDGHYDNEVQICMLLQTAIKGLSVQIQYCTVTPMV